MLFLTFFCFSFLLTAILCLPALRTGINTADEGYLLFGIQQLLKGNVPIRDFRAYDPGRYYFCAFFMKRMGTSFITQRLVMMIPMALSLCLAAYLMYVVIQSWFISLLTMLAVWMWLKPYFKAFEIFFSLFAVFCSYHLILNPDDLSFYLAGLSVGVALFFGLNIGFYLGLAILISWGIALVSSDIDATGSFILLVSGGATGLIPTAILCIKHKGYFRRYWQEKVVTIFSRGATNLPLPLPWVGKKVPQMQHLTPLKQTFFSVLFTALPVIYLTSIVIGSFYLNDKRALAALMLSCGLVGLIYMHHLVSRCDLGHLCQTIHPAILSLVLCVNAIGLTPLLIVFLIIVLSLSFWAAVCEMDNHYKWLVSPENFSVFSNSQTAVIAPKQQIRTLTTIEKVINDYADEQNKSLFLPMFPGFYPLFNQEPACYDIFCVYPASGEKQASMIKEIQHNAPGIIVVQNCPLDSREELKFLNTHPKVWQAIGEGYHQLENIQNLPKDISVFVRNQKH